MKRLAIIYAVQFVLLVSLAVSLCWNIREAADASQRVQEAYRVGVDDGAAMLRGRIIRSILEREIIEEQMADAQKEKL